MRSKFAIFYILILTFIFAQASAQMPVMKAKIGDYQFALRNVKVIQNKGNLIPIKGLDKQKIAFTSPDVARSMMETLAKYTDVKRLDFNTLNANSFDILIIQLESVSDENLAVIKPFLAQANLKTIIFTTHPESEKLPKGFDVILTGNYITPLNESIAAQKIFGGIINLRRPVASAKPKTPFRLGYAPPAALGMNARILEDSIAAIVNYGIEQGAFPGAQVLVAKNGKIIYHQAFGAPTYDKDRLLSTEDIYDMASLSKVSTALAAVMKLNGEGKFNLDDPMKILWPKFKKSNKADLTWRSVLAHNARLQPWIPYWQNTLRKKPKKNGWRFKRCTFKPKQSRRYPIKITDNLWLHRNYRKKMFKAIKKTPLNKEPGYKYSGLAFYIIPTIVEHITGDDFEHYLKSNIYQPLGAKTLTYNPLRFYPKSRIIPTELDTFFRMQQIHGTVHDEGAIMMGGVSGNAGLFGTANDMAKLWQMYLNKGEYGGQRFIKSEVLDEFTKCQYCDEGNYRGLGFDKPKIKYDPAKAGYAKDASAATFGHSGYTGTLIWADPENQLLFIFMSNRVYQTRKNRKLYTLDIRPRLHNTIYSAIGK